MIIRKCDRCKVEIPEGGEHYWIQVSSYNRLKKNNPSGPDGYVSIELCPKCYRDFVTLLLEGLGFRLSLSAEPRHL